MVIAIPGQDVSVSVGVGTGKKVAQDGAVTAPAFDVTNWIVHLSDGRVVSAGSRRIEIAAEC